MLGYAILFVATLLCCLIFERIKITGLVRRLLGSYKSQLEAMKNREMTDEEKQKALMSQVGTQFGLLLRLIGAIVLFVSPFILYVLLDPYSEHLDSGLLYEPLGIGVTFLAAAVYILFKKYYGRVFGK